MGWVNFFLGESQSRIYANMCAKCGCGPTVVSKRGGADRQTDKGTLRLNIVDGIASKVNAPLQVVLLFQYCIDMAMGIAEYA